MPVSIYKDSIYMQEICEEHLSEDSAAKEADKLIDEIARQEFGEDVKIKNVDRKPGVVLPNGEEYYKECQYDLVENISKKEKIMMDN